MTYQKIFILFSIICFSITSKIDAQDINSYKKNQQFSIGVEQDIVPYLLNGYIGTLWIGKNNFRIRSSYSASQIPAFLNKSPFRNQRLKALTISGEYFLKENFEGFWFGSGMGYWWNSFESEELSTRNTFQNVALHSAVGFQFFVYKRLYISPYLGTHFRVSGNKKIDVGSSAYKPRTVVPEVSLKVGLRFPMETKDFESKVRPIKKKARIK